MKKTLTVILMFAVVMAAALGIAELVNWLRPEPVAEPEPVDEPVIVTNVMDESAATLVYLDGAEVQVTGLGAAATEEGVKIAYPGTYRISGSLADGQILVDCDEFHGGVYIMLDGADVTCTTGPAIYVKQSDKTVIHLVEGSVNTLRDGSDYLITEKQDESAGGGIYCDDDLYIEGLGALTVIGSNADGIRSRDGLTVTGGLVTVNAADDAIQGSDHVEIQGGTLVLNAYGDGITTKKGDVTISGGDVTITSAGDGIAATADVYVQGGNLSVTAYGGSTNYETMAVNGLSAKGLKGINVTISGGTLRLDTADDAVNADLNTTVTGGALTLLSGDDALRAAQNLTITGGTIVVETSYEGLEAPAILVEDGVITVDSDNDGIDALNSYRQTGGYVLAAGPQCLNTDGAFTVEGGWMILGAKEEGAPLSFAEGAVTGGTLVVTGTGTTAEFTEDGTIPASFLFATPSTVAAGTEAVLKDSVGGEVFSFVLPQNGSMILVASGAMGLGQEYTLELGGASLTGVLGQESTIVR